ncbi:MAG: hypothetical protein EBZ48_07715, partial [Proteobacteria bacterium]|nr:hypothetical protein [Pseudomonadota bacterium]
MPLDPSIRPPAWLVSESICVKLATPPPLTLDDVIVPEFTSVESTFWLITAQPPDDAEWFSICPA